MTQPVVRYLGRQPESRTSNGLALIGFQTALLRGNPSSVFHFKFRTLNIQEQRCDAQLFDSDFSKSILVTANFSFELIHDILRVHNDKIAEFIHDELTPKTSSVSNAARAR